MVAAEKQYEYQAAYPRYEVREHRLESLQNTRLQPKKQKSQPSVSSREKMMMMMLTVLVGFVCVGLIASTAYAAAMKYQINAMIKESAVLEGEIENLNVEIKSQTNIQVVEEKAKNQLGMGYPSPETYIYLDQPAEVKDFAIVLKAQAYN